MYGIENWEVFIFTALLFIMTPGIDTVFILNKSISQGRKAGIYSTVGINGGILVHTIFASLGLSLVIAQSAIAFMVLKYVGAAYLIYLGFQQLLSNKELKLKASNPPQLSNKQHFFSGLVTNTLNPKVALFFLAFFPQFISKELMGSPLPFIILGTTYAFIGLSWFLLLTLCASIFSKQLKNNTKFNYWLNKVSGLIYILMGIKIALTKK
ncbi:LysE family translocator [Aureispira anguillae]|uniref:LysE family translocator n=1 Tax=Aureispira anguillae TaxID=2864201 RepID=A0A916DTH1_9BACT|nr:LysE family translocator [Aureispira anguillae]BDS11787.1 LysE family translocator [Aureispira anguillae]